MPSYFGRAGLQEAGPSSSLPASREALLCHEFRQRSHLPFLALGGAGTSTGDVLSVSTAYSIRADFYLIP